MRNWLNGKKTYLVAAIAIMGIVAAYAGGEYELSDAIEKTIAAILAVTLRVGVSKA